MNNIEAKRHSLAHVLAGAVQKLYPEAYITLGPTIDTGFYYDIDFGEIKIGEDDLEKIEKEMRTLLPTWSTFTEKKVSYDEAKKLFAENPYKIELIKEINGRGEDITLYTSGDFTDLCRGGHVESVQDIDPDSWKLDRIAGAYWRGNENNKMLTRIYGLAFENKNELDNYLTLREEMKKRDHRKLGRELDLFTFSDLVGPGLPLFTPKGTAMRKAIVDKIYAIQKNFGYTEVAIPHITKKDLYEKSGHWEKFGDELFKVHGAGDAEFVMKPMNCPHHTQIYAGTMRSYRDLPQRYMETTMVYRDEQAGELLGLSRVRSITQDDGHVFCTEGQMKEEITNIVSVIREFYSSLEMWNEKDFWVSLSVRSEEKMEKYLGDNELWGRAEKVLEEIAEQEKLPYKRVEGEAAFYGPKLDFMFRDSMGREWQLATAQLDFNMPNRFNLEYTDENGERKTPVMIHRAVAGSLERFMSLIIEHFAGYFPLWLAPVQTVVIPVKDDTHSDYAKEIVSALKAIGVRTEMWNSEGSFGKTVRRAKEEQKIPYTIIVGDKEKDSGILTIETKDEKIEESIESFITRIKNHLQ